MDIVGLLIVWLVTAVSLVIISQLRVIEIDSFNKALISAAVLGILNVLILPILNALALPLNVILSGFLVTLLVNAIIFGLAAWLITGFRLPWGIWSALLGALALTFANQIILQLLERFLNISVR